MAVLCSEPFVLSRSEPECAAISPFPIRDAEQRLAGWLVQFDEGPLNIDR